MLVGVDGATWTVIGRLIEKGELPAFKRLTDEGSYMPRFNTMGSTVSPVVWTSVATGRLPKDHGTAPWSSSQRLSNEIAWCTLGNNSEACLRRPDRKTVRCW